MLESICYIVEGIEEGSDDIPPNLRAIYTWAESFSEDVEE